MNNALKPIRLTIQQPSLAKYRVPVYQELAQRQDLTVKLYYAQSPGIPNVEPVGFAAECLPMRQFCVLGQTLLWHTAQWRFAVRSATDVLILSWNARYLSLIPALLRARKNGVRTILWGHGYSKHDSGLRSWPRRTIAKLADVLLFYNHTAAQTYIDAGWDPKRVYVALNALDQRPIQAARQAWLAEPEKLAAFKREHGLDKRPVILFVSRLSESRRVDWLLEAAAKMISRYPSLKVVVVGKGEDQSRLQEMARKLGIERQVLFPGAIYEEMQIAPWFLSASVLGYPMDIGLSLLHAFGYGVPVVTSNRLESQAPEMEAFEDGRNGRLYEHGNVQSLAKALSEVIESRDGEDAIGRYARQTVVERFTIERMVDGFAKAVTYAAAQGRT